MRRSAAKRLALLLLLLLSVSLLTGCLGGVTHSDEPHSGEPQSGVSDSGEPGSGAADSDPPQAAPSDDPQGDDAPSGDMENGAAENQEELQMTLRIDGAEISVRWEQNDATAELAALAAQAPVVVSAARYGGFEQVGSLPQSFTRSDRQTTTRPGDIVLYSGNQLVVFFGSNSWSYTRLGRIEGLTDAELTALLDRAQVEITLSA